MPTAFRIFKRKFSAAWFDGEGAFRYGGRWNSRGARVFYAAESLALAAMEMLVHLNSEELLRAYSYVTAEFDEDFVLAVEDFKDLPDDWNASPPPLELQQIGDDWVKSAASAVLRVPTSVLPVGSNYLFNLGHPDFTKIELGEPQTFVFDKRLYEKQ